MLSVAAYLRWQGVTVTVADCHVQRAPTDFAGYDAVFLGVNISNIENTLKTALAVKTQDPEIPVVVGGLAEGMATRLLKHPEVDAAILGEGERTAYEYLTAERKEHVPGLLLRGPRGVMKTTDRRLLMRLDTLPFPALDLVPLRRYHMPISRRRPISSIVTSLGCPSNCTFCSHIPFWRPRSARHVVSELAWQEHELGVQEIAVNDDDFTLDPNRVMAICNGIKEYGLDFIWQLKNGVRADQLSLELLERMHDCGLWLLGIAPETGSAETLLRIQKGFGLDDVKKVVGWCKDIGIATYAFYTFGYPWENATHMQETVAFIRDLDTDFMHITRVFPIEGTPLYQEFGGFQGLQDASFHSGWSGESSSHLTERCIKASYRAHYLSPKRLLSIGRNIPPANLLRLVSHALRTGDLLGYASLKDFTPRSMARQEDNAISTGFRD